MLASKNEVYVTTRNGVIYGTFYLNTLYACMA